MNYFLVIISCLNFFGLIYLVYLFYRKNSQRSAVIHNLPLDVKKNLKINLTRFNPFEEVGGDQSFVLCLLDNTNSGVIITSLHNRTFTRVYAKTIKNGECDSASLSKEESKALLKTINS